MSSVESHLGLLDSIVHNADKLCEGALVWGTQGRLVPSVCYVRFIIEWSTL